MMTDAEFEMVMLRRLARKLDQHHPCLLCRDHAVRVPSIPNLTISTTEDRDGLFWFLISYLNRRSELTVECFAPELDADPLEWAKLLSFISACKLSASVR